MRKVKYLIEVQDGLFWETHSSYDTKKERDAAFKKLTRVGIKRSLTWFSDWIEYRKTTSYYPENNL